MAEKRDYYEVLNVEKACGKDDIRRAYRKLALKYHPDNFQGDKAEAEVKFREISEAYEVLSEPEKRQVYDRYGHQGLRGQGVHDFSSMGFGDIFSMFQDIFGGSGGGHGPARGYDLETEIELSLAEVATGADKTLEFNRRDFCEECSGSGAKPGSKPDRCPTCRGYGQVETSGGGFFRMVRTCPRCHGRGQVVSDPCPHCQGTGRMKKKRVLSVRVPAGVHEGQVVQVRGEGEPAEDSTSRGDLRCYIRVQTHPFLQRHDNDLLCQVPISFPQAALGAKIEVPTLKGKEHVDVPSGTQHGDLVRMKGKGLPEMRSGRKGDQLVQVLIEVPRKLTKKQQELLRQLSEGEDELLPNKKSFMERLKDYFSLFLM